jgi:hypothetical protein
VLLAPQNIARKAARNYVSINQNIRGTGQATTGHYSSKPRACPLRDGFFMTTLVSSNIAEIGGRQLLVGHSADDSGWIGT